MKAILKKLYSNNKRSTSVDNGLKKVTLNVQDNLKTYLEDQETGLNDMEAAIEEITSLSYKLKNGQEYQYDASNFFMEEFESVKQKINDIGIDMPDELVELENKKMQLDTRYYLLVDQFKNIDFSFNTFN